MAHTWKYAVALGLVGTALTVGCVVKEGDADGAGAAGESGSGGTGGKGGTGGTGGTSGKAGGTTGGSSGKGGATGGSSGKGGATTGGASGTGGSGDAGMAGADTGGTGGSAAGTGGTGGTDMQPVGQCEGLEDSTPYPSCEAADARDDCDTCIQMNCCEESKACYGLDPANACGWGGPSEDVMGGAYSGYGEIGCYITCMSEQVEMNEGICDDTAINYCSTFCSSDCSLIPDATNDMVACLSDHCAVDCFVSGTDTCGG